MTDRIEQLARLIAFWHGQKITIIQSRDRGGALTIAAQRGYGKWSHSPQRYADAHWREYRDAAEAAIGFLELFVGWQDIETAPDDGRTIEVRATILMHRIAGASFEFLPKDWRPDSPQSIWRFTHWREAVSETPPPAAVVGDRLV